MVKLVDTPDLGSGDASRGGSSPSIRTKITERMDMLQHFFEAEDYDTCEELVPSISKFFRAMLEEDRDYLQAVQSVLDDRKNS